VLCLKNEDFADAARNKALEMKKNGALIELNGLLFPGYYLKTSLPQHKFFCLAFQVEWLMGLAFT
jgi:hypothetical protein